MLPVHANLVVPVSFFPMVKGILVNANLEPLVTTVSLRVLSTSVDDFFIFILLFVFIFIQSSSVCFAYSKYGFTDYCTFCYLKEMKW